MTILFKPFEKDGKKFVRYYRDGREVARIETGNQMKTIAELVRQQDKRH
jgi:hypothetical protein